MWLPTLLFTLFALLSTLGALLVVRHHRGWAAGLLAATATLLFFLGLAGLLYWLLAGEAMGEGVSSSRESSPYQPCLKASRGSTRAARLAGK